LPGRFERLLLWLWRELPLPRPLRQAYLSLTHPRFLIGVVAYIQDEQGRTLTLYHTYRRRFPWGLPGGYLQGREEPAAGLAREVREEVGLEIEVGQVIAAALYQDDQLDLLFPARVIGGSLRPSNEIARWRWSEPDGLDDLLPNQLALLRRAGILRERSA
jgi:8-oxo-dGTP pyrophosphatase MutT (NUDIX family)